MEAYPLLRDFTWSKKSVMTLETVNPPPPRGIKRAMRSLCSPPVHHYVNINLMDHLKVLHT